jgi:ADP-heptose:LPS heptosyltransferase
MKILLIRFSSLGDVVLQTATIKWLKDRFGAGLEIYFLTSKEFAPLLAGHDSIKEVITYDRRAGEGLWGLARRLKNRYSFDLLFDVHATTRSALLRLFLFSIPRLTIDKRRLERLVLQVPGLSKKWWRWNFLGLTPQVQRIPQDFHGLFHAPMPEVLPLTFTPPLPTLSHPRDYVVLAPVASFSSKHWPVTSYVTLAQKILQETSLDVVIVAGPTDTHCEAFKAIDSERLLNLQGKTKLLESAAWLQGARAVVGNDSGMNHIAEACGVKVVTLFGPTHEAFGFAPHLPGSKALSHDLWCRPCSATGARECFRAEKLCLTLTTPDQVWHELQGLL